MSAFLLVLMVIVAGCTHVADRYSLSADNVAALRAANGKHVNIGPIAFESGVAETEIPCAAMAIAPSDQASFAEYIRKALIDELKIAGIYSPTGPVTIVGTLNKLEVDASAFSINGQWLIEMTVNNGERSFTVSERYTFRSQTMTSTACEGAARRFGSAVQNLIGKIVTHPEFIAMVR